MDARFSISNMSTEWGPLVGWFPVDEVTIRYLRARDRGCTSKELNDSRNADLEGGHDSSATRS